MNNQNISKAVLPWYLNTWFIALLMAFSIFVVPCIIGIAFIIMQHLEWNKIKKKADAIEDIEIYKQNVMSDIEEERTKAEIALNNIKDNITNEQTTLDNWKKEVAIAKKELSDIEGDIEVAYISPYAFEENITSEEYKNKLSMLRIKENDFIKSDKCIIYDASTTGQQKRILTNDVKQLMRCFNSETSNIINNVTVKNADTCRSKLQKTFETLNKLFVTDGISLNPKLLEFKLDELSLIYDYMLKLEQEKEQQKAIKEQMVEEEKVRREIEREKAKIEKEETQFKNEVNKLMTYMQKASDIEKQLYVDKIKELEEKINLLEKDKENVLQREQNTRAGFVYVISNIGSFGENIYKIGMTRRLEPMDRVKELGDASVPFEFDVHAMIFSDDAPELENILHKTFADNAVNKVNPKKEFFKVSLKDIEDVVKTNHNATVTFTEIAKAEQYRETLRIEKNKS